MRAVLLSALLLASLLAGCVSETTGPACQGDAAACPPASGFSALPSFPNPQPPSVTRLEFVAQLTDAQGVARPTAGGNFVFGDYVFSSGLGSGFFIADIKDPAHPVLVYNSTADSETPFSRKAEVIDHPDGRRTLVLATQSNGMHFWNVTDPSNPEWASVVEFDRNHNIAVVPGSELVFNSPSSGKGAANTLIDASDPYDPRILGDYGTHGCHGVQFSKRLGQEGFRAYCAAIERTEIWDLTKLDPAAKDFGVVLLGIIEGAANSPVTGSPVANPPVPPNPTGLTTTPVRNLHHFAAANEAGNILIVGDEHRGGGNPGACYAYDDATGLSTPVGAIWFYDISDPAAPAMLSWLSPPTVLPTVPTVPTSPNTDPSAVGQLVNGAYTTVPNCTAHFGTIVPGEDKFVIAWYSAGVLLVDFTDPTSPRILDQYQPEGVNTWNARVWNGYVFTGDIARGMDVLRLA